MLSFLSMPQVNSVVVATLAVNPALANRFSRIFNQVACEADRICALNISPTVALVTSFPSSLKMLARTLRYSGAVAYSPAPPEPNLKVIGSGRKSLFPGIGSPDSGTHKEVSTRSCLNRSLFSGSSAILYMLKGSLCAAACTLLTQRRRWRAPPACRHNPHLRSTSTTLPARTSKASSTLP